MKYVKGCLAVLIIASALAVIFGLVAAGIGLGWELVTD